ncbi:hypothetical protein BOSE21B_91308 [Bosea sp. 21B]|nr:hypothetical protein BOSE21B_91308 [Bosea sp. 21B]VXB48093.1 hypothetical protein BOSE125_130894 [Bosea sp. 125]
MADAGYGCRVGRAALLPVLSVGVDGNIVCYLYVPFHRRSGGNHGQAQDRRPQGPAARSTRDLCRQRPQ